MRMEGKLYCITVFQVLGNIGYLHGINMRHGHFHSNRNVDNSLAVWSWLPYIQHGITYLQSVLWLSTGKALWRIFKTIVSASLLSELLQQLGTINSNLLDFFLVLAEYLLTLSKGGGIVHMNNGVLNALESLKGLFDNMLSSLSQYLNSYIIWNQIFIHQTAQESIFSFRGCWEAYFNFLEANLNQHLEELYLLIETHRNNQGLIAISQVNRAPGWSLVWELLLSPAHINSWGHKITRLILFYIFHHQSLPCLITQKLSTETMATKKLRLLLQRRS